MKFSNCMPKRRGLLKAATTLAAVSSIAGVGRRSEAGESNPASSPAFVDVDKALRQAVNAKAIAGIVAMGADDTGIIYEGAFGPGVTADSVFWIASMTKTATAIACMQLVEQGRLRLDQPMGDLLPKLKAPKVLVGFDTSGAPLLRPATRPITLLHLMTHTSGFTYNIWSEPLARYLKVTGVPSIGEFKNAAFDAPLEFDPGERWEYGISMDWVGKAIEAVTDQSLEGYFRENIFQPLGMVDTGFLLSTAQRGRIVPMHRREADGSLTRVAFEQSQRPEFFMGGGALFSTPRDYMRMLQMLLHGGALNGARILKPETVATMQQNHIAALNVTTLETVNPKASNDANLFPGMVQKWGLSFDINTEKGPAGRSAGSLAWAGLFNTYFWLDPVRHVTGVIMAQLLPFADQQVLDLFAQFESGIYKAIAPA